MGKLLIVKFVKFNETKDGLKIWLGKKEYTFFVPTALEDKFAVGQLQFVKTSSRPKLKRKNTLVQIQAIEEADDSKRKMITLALKNPDIIKFEDNKPLIQDTKRNVVKNAFWKLKTKQVWLLPKKEDK